MREHKLVIVADDLTGACDSAVAFAQCGLRSVVVLEEAETALANVDVMVRSTDSRHLPAPEAFARLQQAVDEAGIDTQFFKKIDSVFRGNTLFEIVSAVKLMPHDLAIIAPAYPAVGRRSFDGVVAISDLSGERRIPVLRKLQSHGLDVHYVSALGKEEAISQGLEQCLRSEKHVVYSDSYLHKHLEALVNAATRLQQRITWIGSGGLAHALAKRMQGPHRELFSHVTRGRVIVFAGSDHPVTRDQLHQLCDRTRVAERSPADRSWPVVREGDVLLIRLPYGKVNHEHIQRAMLTLAPESIGCMVMTGGDTAALVCRALGIQALELSREFAPGLPLGVALGGKYDRVSVMLKSGGFGESDVLCRIAARFSPQREVA